MSHSEWDQVQYDLVRVRDHIPQNIIDDLRQYKNELSSLVVELSRELGAAQADMMQQYEIPDSEL
jgi:hypothetical protein